MKFGNFFEEASKPNSMLSRCLLCGDLYELRVSASDLINLSKEINFAYTDVVKSRKRYLMNMTASIFEEFVICM